ncbi:hypothetical protein D3C87_1792340 [compost metagenome]
MTWLAAVSRRVDTFSNTPACAWVCAVISCVACPSACVSSCWRVAACAPASSHSWPSASAIEASLAVQADRRSSSLAASAACRSAFDWSSVCKSEAECCSKVAAAASSAC